MKLGLMSKPTPDVSHGCGLSRTYQAVGRCQVLGNSLLRSQYNASGEAGLAKDWWPDDPEASHLAQSNGCCGSDSP